MKTLHHLGVAPKDPQKTKQFFEEVLGLKCIREEELLKEGVRTSVYPLGASGNAPKLEILESLTDDSPVGRFLTQRGSGVHHFAVRVDDISAVLQKLKTQGVELIDEVARTGEGGTRIAFIHPRATGGLLVELVEDNAGM